MCQSDPGVKANAQAVDLDEPDEECKEIQHVWALSVCKKSETLPVDSGKPLEHDHGFWCRGTRGLAG